MDIQTRLASLIDLAESCGIAVRLVPTSGNSQAHPGGAMVRLNNREIMFLDPTAAPAEQIAVLAEALRGRNELQERFIPPEIRRDIEGES